MLKEYMWERFICSGRVEDYLVCRELEEPDKTAESERPVTDTAINM